MSIMSTASPGPSAPLPDGVRHEVLHGADALVVATGAARATVHLDGGHLTSWRPTGEADLLWTSPLSEYGAGAATRGGVPLIGPWFGPGRDLATEPKHGWLRTHRWELVGAEADGDDILLDLALDGADPEGAGVGARARFRIGHSLDVDLTLTAGRTPLDLEAALHTYLAVSDVRQIGIDGLVGIDYLDNRRGLSAQRQEEGILVLSGATDRIYDTGTEIVVHDELGRRTIQAVPRGTGTTVVWNPWDELVGTMDDIPDESWTQFVCIEPAIAKDRFVALEPGASHTIGVTYRIGH